MPLLAKSIRLGGCLIAFVLGLALTSHVLARITPIHRGSNLDAKLQHWKKHKDEYAAVYVGSSMVNHHFIPVQFDEIAAAQQGAFKSLNFGMDGMWPPESFQILGEILAEKPTKLRYVFFELMGFKPGAKGNEDSLRTIAWHDLPHTLMISKHVLSVPMEGQRTFQEKWGALLLHWQLFARQSVHVGAGQDWLKTRLNLAKERKTKGIKQEGYEPGRAGGLQGEDAARFEKVVARLRTSPAKPIQPLLREALDDAAAQVRKAGAQPIFVLSPSIYGAERFSDWPAASQTFFNFNDPDLYPSLYDPANRYDLDHLNPDGARQFTALFAEQFGSLLKKR